MEIRQWFGLHGRVDRPTYAFLGIFGVLLKHNIDRLLAYKILHTSWGMLNYLSPLGILSGNSGLSHDQKEFLFVLAMTSVPFIWLGIAMTVRRLRDAGLRVRLVLLFFLPAVNVLLFILLCALPGRNATRKAIGWDRGVISAVLPKSRFGISALASIAGAVLGTALGWFIIHSLGDYGWTLFLAIPFFMGFLAAWLFCYGHLRERSFGDCAEVALLSICFAGVVLLGIAADGFICIVMAAPIAAALAVLGAYLAYVMQSATNLESQSGAVFGMFMAIPFLAVTEFLAPLPTPVYQTHTSIEISAPPRLVWQHVISFPHIGAPLNPIFRVGISYPLEAQITGTGLTADRKCIFSSGAFREPILAWDEGKHFAFGISEEPLLMKELSPYSDIHVRHLDDHDFRPQRADFYLTELPGGRTRLDGWTTYENRMWPGPYWRIWTDAILHQIHLRVFRHVKELAEADARLGASHSSLP
jgi:uncharacterized membrane protein YhaH (DUF805 family)